MDQSLIRLAAWSAFAHAALAVLGLAALLLFFALGGFWGPLNDLLSVFWALTLVPIALLLYVLHRSLHMPAVLMVTIVGIAAMIAFAVLQLLLVIRVVAYQQTVNAIMILYGVAGLFLLSSALLARSRSTLPPRVIWAMLAYGLGNIGSSAAFFIDGPSSPFAGVSFLAAAVVGLAWGVWLGQLLGNGTLLEMSTLPIGGSQ